MKLDSKKNTTEIIVIKERGKCEKVIKFYISEPNFGLVAKPVNAVDSKSTG